MYSIDLGSSNRMPQTLSKCQSDMACSAKKPPMSKINRLLKAKNLGLGSIGNNEISPKFTSFEKLNRIQSATQPIKAGSFVESGSNQSFLSEPSQNENVQVCIRMRPINEREKALNDESGTSVAMDPMSNQVSINSKGKFGIGAVMRQYKFDFVADHIIDQEGLYENSAKAIVESCLNGINGSIFAYG